MSKFKESTARRQTVTALANKVTEIKFIDTNPNAIFINNMGSVLLYISRSTNVSDSNYELIIGVGAYQSFVRPLGINSIYVYATSDSVMNIESFEVEDLKPSDIPETQPIYFLSASNQIVVASALPAGTNNIGDVDLASAIPTGNNRIGKIKIVDDSDVAFGTVGNPINVDGMAVTLDLPATPTIYNVTMTNADTEYSQALPANCKKILVSIRDGDSTFNYRLAFETLKVATPTEPYLKYKGNVEFDSDLLKMSGTPGSLYFACSDAGKVIQIIAWA